MLVYSKILGKYYDADNDGVVYLTNMIQVAKYLNNGAADDLVDILYSGTARPDTLVFVFRKSPHVKELYRKWQAHELT